MSGPLSTYGPRQLAEHLGVADWQVSVARVIGALPQPDRSGGKWSASLAEQIRADLADLLAAVGTIQPMWAGDVAQRLAALLTLPVVREDVDVLAATGHLTRVMTTQKGWALYLPAHVDALPGDLVERTIADRDAGRPAAYSAWTATKRLGWYDDEFIQVAKRRKLATLPGGMWSRDVVDALAADTELHAALNAVRLLTANEAAARLGIRRTDFNLIVAAGWLEQAGTKIVYPPHKGCW